MGLNDWFGKLWGVKTSGTTSVDMTVTKPLISSALNTNNSLQSNGTTVNNLQQQSQMLANQYYAQYYTSANLQQAYTTVSLASLGIPISSIVDEFQTIDTSQEEKKKKDREMLVNILKSTIRDAK